MGGVRTAIHAVLLAICLAMLGCQKISSSDGSEHESELPTQTPQNSGDTELLSGGDHLEVWLPAARRLLLNAIAVKKLSPNCDLPNSPEIQLTPTYLYLKQMTPTEKIACELFLQAYASDLLDLLRDFDGVEFVVSDGPLYLDGVRKTALTEHARTGAIFFDPERASGLTFLEIVAMGAHEMGHKVPPFLRDAALFFGVKVERVLNLVGAALALYQAPGRYSRDVSFGTNGTVSLPIDVKGVERENDGKLLTFGNATVFGVGKIYAVRMNDSGIWQAAQEIPTPGWNAELRATISRAEGGYWLLAKFSSAQVQAKAALIQLRADLTVETTILLDFASTNAVPRVLVGEPARKSLYVGVDVFEPDFSQAAIAIMKLGASDGKQDPSFGPVRFTFTGNSPKTLLGDLLVLSDGKVLATGMLINAGSLRPGYVLRFDREGKLDADFATNGVWRSPFGAQPAVGGNAPGAFYALAVDSKGNILVGGSIRDNRFESQVVYSGIVASLTKDGMVDSSFGNQGRSFFRRDGDLLQQRIARLRVNGDDSFEAFLLAADQIEWMIEGAWPGKAAAMVSPAAKVEIEATEACSYSKAFFIPLPYFAGANCLLRTW